MPVFINIIVCILALLAFILCGYYSLFRKSLLSKDIDSIIDSYKDNSSRDSVNLQLPQQFTHFLARRKLNYWSTVLKEIVGPSMLLSLILNIVQWGNSLRASNGWDEVKQFIENPGIVFYANFAFIIYVALTIFCIDHAIRSFEAMKKTNA